MGITIFTWNIGHLSNTSELRIEKLGNISSLLKVCKPDLLVLQELNEDLRQFSDISRFWQEIQALGYTYHSGPLLKAGSSEYVKKTGTQYEYYAAFYSSRVKILATSTILNKNFKSWEFKDIEQENQLVEWVTDRPVVIRHIKVDQQFQFYLGVVHTSPSFPVANTSRGYIWGTLSKLANNPWILAGDWYVKEDAQIVVGEKEELKWSDFLKANNCKLFKPNNIQQTNFPPIGNGMIADYFVTSSHFNNQETTAFFREAKYKQNGQPSLRQIPWKSDHIPVFGSFEPVRLVGMHSIEANNFNQNIFPFKGSYLTVAQSDEPILLNGMKVIFDQSIGVYPVNLESKEEESRHVSHR
jgi:hypothetical protein